MKTKIFAVMDLAAEAYMQPFFAATTGIALRSFNDGVNKPGTGISEHPEHFVLFELGDFDDSTGLFETGSPRQVALATDLKK